LPYTTVSTKSWKSAIINKPFIQMKKVLSLCLFFVATSLFAHEFWLMPSKFKLKIGQSINLQLFVGEDFMGDIWGNRKKRLLKLTHLTEGNKGDLTSIALKSDSLPIPLKFETEGTHLLTMESKNSFIALEADKFNDYLKEDGIENIYELRQKQGQLKQPSKELYRRCAKTLIQVGNKYSDIFKKNTQMPLEIIPLNNPYQMKAGEAISIKVLFNNQPLKNKMVVAWHKTATQKTTHRKLKTDANGALQIKLDKAGYWMISTVHMEEVKNNPEANYQSYWGNLTFELQ